MDTITLFDQDNVTITLCEFHYDKEIDGVRATVEVKNRKNTYVDVVLTELWDGERFYKDYSFVLCSVPPKKTMQEKFLELNSTYEEENRILKFYNGHFSACSFRIEIYTHSNGTALKKFCSKGKRIIVSKFSIDGVSVMPAENYRIEYDGETLFASTKYYIPFEINRADANKSQQIQALKEEISMRLDTLETNPQKVLVARYGEIGKHRFYDIENMCIYNLGTSAFSRCCPTDIVFAELKSNEIDRFLEIYGEKVDQRCFYAYSAVFKKRIEEWCESQRLIAGWENIKIDTSIPNTPYRYWTSIRRQYDRVFVKESLEQGNVNCFGIQVTLHLPKRILPASVMKPLLDGIVCAFHKRKDIDELLHAVVRENFEIMVVNAEDHLSVLGEQNYVSPYRGNSVKWNPADERLKFAWVSVVTENCEPYFEGKIFKWEQE